MTTPGGFDRPAGRSLVHILAAADREVTLALIGVADSVILHVAFLLNLADHGTAACMAGDQTGKGEVVLAVFGLLGDSAIEHALHTCPHLSVPRARTNALVIPLEPARIESVAQDSVNCAHGHLGAALGIGKPRCVRLVCRLLQAHIALAIRAPSGHQDKFE